MNNKETIEKIEKILKSAGLKIIEASGNVQSFKTFAEEYLETLCTVYDINDIKLTGLAITSYHEVSNFLDTKLLARGSVNHTLFWHYNMVLKAFMERIYIQACRQYD